MIEDGENARALILAPFSAHQLDKLRQTIDTCYESWFDTRRIYDTVELISRLSKEQIKVLVIEADFVFAEVFEKVPSLRFVGICRNTTTHVEVEAATTHGVLVVNTPDRNAQAVAELALGLMLSLSRRIPTAHVYVTDGLWQNPIHPYVSMRGSELSGRTIGIIGLGSIGLRLASMATALGMDCIAYDPYVIDAPNDISLTGLETLLAASDFVAIHAPATSETENLLDAHKLALMRSTAYLVNLSDPSIISEEALVTSLRNQRIAGAALDVFETHPIAPTNPLLSLDNVILTPHIGGATGETIERHSKSMADDIRRFCDGKKPINLVNPETWRQCD